MVADAPSAMTVEAARARLVVDPVVVVHLAVELGDRTVMEVDLALAPRPGARRVVLGLVAGRVARMTDVRIAHVAGRTVSAGGAAVRVGTVTTGSRDVSSSMTDVTVTAVLAVAVGSAAVRARSVVVTVTRVADVAMPAPGAIATMPIGAPAVLTVSVRDGRTVRVPLVDGAVVSPRAGRVIAASAATMMLPVATGVATTAADVSARTEVSVVVGSIPADGIRATEAETVGVFQVGTETIEGSAAGIRDVRDTRTGIAHRSGARVGPGARVSPGARVDRTRVEPGTAMTAVDVASATSVVAVASPVAMTVAAVGSRIARADERFPAAMTGIAAARGGMATAMTSVDPVAIRVRPTGMDHTVIDAGGTSAGIVAAAHVKAATAVLIVMIVVAASRIGIPSAAILAPDATTAILG